MSAESNIRGRLEAIAEGDYAPPDDAAAFVLEILPHLGSSDGELREQHVYGTLHRWIVRRTLDDVTIVDLARILVDPDHLFLGIETPGDEKVFMRAFSVLLLAPIVHAHRQDPFLSSSDLSRILTKAIEYTDREQDLRGYVSGEALWAHGVAHAADVFGQLGQCEDVAVDELISMLDAIARRALTDSDVFIFEEDTRMAAAAIEILKRSELDRDWVTSWFLRLVPETRWTGELPWVHHRYANARNALHCLYFQGREAGLPEDVIAGIEAALSSLPKR
jgi:hypothetical protein